jgi:hypothetical protein
MSFEDGSYYDDDSQTINDDEENEIEVFVRGNPR